MGLNRICPTFKQEGVSYLCTAKSYNFSERGGVEELFELRNGEAVGLKEAVVDNSIITVGMLLQEFDVLADSSAEQRRGYIGEATVCLMFCVVIFGRSSSSEMQAETL